MTDLHVSDPWHRLPGQISTVCDTGGPVKCPMITLPYCDTIACQLVGAGGHGQLLECLFTVFLGMSADVLE